MTYGWMPEHDYRTMDKILNLVCETFHEGILNTLELGVRDGRTSRGMHQYLKDKGRINFHTGIDNNNDIETPVPFEGCNLIIGNSMEVYNQIKNSSQHFCFIDACHNYAMTMIDFLLYSAKVKVGGILAFHDTSPNIKPFTDYQGTGSKEDPDNYISCRKAVRKLGLLDNPAVYFSLGWNIIFDEYDEAFPTGGIIALKKLH